LGEANIERASDTPFTKENIKVTSFTDFQITGAQHSAYFGRLSPAEHFGRLSQILKNGNSNNAYCLSSERFRVLNWAFNVIRFSRTNGRAIAVTKDQASTDLMPDGFNNQRILM
jgi:hypothetical protein